MSKHEQIAIELLRIEYRMISADINEGYANAITMGIRLQNVITALAGYLATPTPAPKRKAAKGKR